MKICGKCKIEKSLDEFHKNKSTRSGLASYCKPCSKKNYDNWRKSNLSKIRENNRIYRNKNLEKIRSYQKNWIQNNIERVNKSKEKYQFANFEKIKESKKRYRNSNLNNKIACALRSRMNLAIKSSQKAGSAVRDLGCSIEDLRTHLEYKFQKGMTWENRGKYGWHIDHIVPLSKFDLSKKEEFLKACHYTNLQPLWAKDNLKKHNKNYVEIN